MLEAPDDTLEVHDTFVTKSIFPVIPTSISSKHNTFGNNGNIYNVSATAMVMAMPMVTVTAMAMVMMMPTAMVTTMVMAMPTVTLARTVVTVICRKHPEALDPSGVTSQNLDNGSNYNMQDNGNDDSFAIA
jgi:hypothetical protein